jgi:hypothetical protein
MNDPAGALPCTVPPLRSEPADEAPMLPSKIRPTSSLPDSPPAIRIAADDVVRRHESSGVAIDLRASG